MQVFSNKYSLKISEKCSRTSYKQKKLDINTTKILINKEYTSLREKNQSPSALLNLYWSILTIFYLHGVVNKISQDSFFTLDILKKHEIITFHLQHTFTFDRELTKYNFSQLNSEAVHMRWAGRARWAGSHRWDDFYPTFMWNLLSQFNQKVSSVAGKRLFWSCSF